MAPPRPRPALLMLLLVAVLLLSHIALCSSAAPAAGKPKGKAAGGRKALLADDGEEVPTPAKKAKGVAAAGKIKKKVGVDAKNQTKAVKVKKSESDGAVKATKKSAAAGTKAPAEGAVAKAKVPKVDKAATAKSKGTDTGKPAKVAKAGSTKAVKPVKTAKSESAAKAKKPSNSTVDAGAKPAKSSKKQPVVAGDKANAKVNATATNEATEVEEDVVFAEETEGTDDLISEFKGLPARLQETLMPDLARLSHTSKVYLSAANTGIADGVRPILGGRWAAGAASAASIVLLLLPLFMLTALVRRMAPYLPLLHRALLLAQAYLAIYFATLALAAAATGLEPLRLPRRLAGGVRLDAGRAVARVHGLPHAPDGGPRRHLLRGRLAGGGRQRGRHQGAGPGADGGGPRRRPALLRRRFPPRRGRRGPAGQLARVRRVRRLLRRRLRVRAPRGGRKPTSPAALTAPPRSGRRAEQI
uniref:Uncharacterized protein n=1 Tax=Oryza brachyantha TaxID=4533 RepID=J3MSX9_ORYBR